MLNKNFNKISWGLWGIFILFAVLILVANFIFQIAVDSDKKLSLAMNSLFIILNVISLTFLLIFQVYNLNNKKIDWQSPLNIGLWISLILYIFFGISSSIVLLNDDFYVWKAIMTMLSFISAILLFPFIVMSLISKNNSNKTINYAMIVFVILYLIINLLLTFIIFLNLTNLIAFLVTVTILNLVTSTIFFGLVTKHSCTINKNNSN